MFRGLLYNALKVISELDRMIRLTHLLILSLGFLDGGDRAMLLDSRSRLPSPTPKLYHRPTLASSDTSESSSGSQDSDPASLATCSIPTASLLVTNLPTLLFSQAQDLHPLFFPFGHIEKLEIVQVSPLGTMSVVVQYSAAHVAQEAKETLSGQLYGSYQIEARYVKPIRSNLLDLSTSGSMTTDRKTDCRVSTSGDLLDQPRTAADDSAGCYSPGRMKDLSHSSQLGLATGSFFHRNPFAIPLPGPSLLTLPSVFPGAFQDYHGSCLPPVDSKFVYFVSLFLLLVLLSTGGAPTKYMDFNCININSFCRIKCTTTLSIRAQLLECFPWNFGLKCFNNLQLPCFSDPPFLVFFFFCFILFSR